MDPKMMSALMGKGGMDSAPTDDAVPDPIQSAFDAIRAAVDEAERSIVTGRNGDAENPAEEAAPDEEAE